MKIKDMLFGKIDAYHEFLTSDRENFKNIFFDIPNIDVNKILNGDVYYILGNKGTGKTMLLKYLESIVSEPPETQFAEFIRFKRDVDEEQRNIIKRSGIPNNAFEEIIDSEIPNDTSIDSSLAWQAYIIKVIYNRIQCTESGVFIRDENWNKLGVLLKEVYGKNEKENSLNIKRIIPKIKRGNIALDFPSIAKTNIEFEWQDKDSGTVRFYDVAKKIVDLYSKLSPTKKKIYIFIDELELSFKKSKSYRRDVALIRDLIVAMEYLSDLNRQNMYHVYIVAAIRTEVYHSVVSIGDELNKSVIDFGITITWGQNGGDIENHPLLKMLEKRIQYSEKSNGLSKTNDIWTNYFPTSVFSKKTQNYILDQTWCKPRDITRFFGLIQKRYGDRERFTQEIFEGIRKDYAKESWSEFSETLSASYNLDSIEGIKKSLIGMSLPFTLAEYSQILKQKSELSKEVKELIRTHTNAFDILDDLYKCGIIGNYEKRQVRFVFKGDDDFDPTMQMTIHYPLLRFFDAKNKNFQ